MLLEYAQSHQQYAQRQPGHWRPWQHTAPLIGSLALRGRYRQYRSATLNIIDSTFSIGNSGPHPWPRRRRRGRRHREWCLFLALRRPDLTNCTLSGNQAIGGSGLGGDGLGGGLDNSFFATATHHRLEIINNQALGGSGGPGVNGGDGLGGGISVGIYTLLFASPGPRR